MTSMARLICLLVLAAICASCGAQTPVEQPVSLSNGAASQYAPASNTEADDKITRHQEVRPVLEALGDITSIANAEQLAEVADKDWGEEWAARRASRQNQTGARIYQVVDRLTTSEQVALLALACRSLLGDQDAKDEGYSWVLDVAYFRCVRNLHSGKRPESHERLVWLERKSHLSGGDAVHFYEITGRSPAT